MNKEIERYRAVAGSRELSQGSERMRRSRREGSMECPAVPMSSQVVGV